MTPSSGRHEGEALSDDVERELALEEFENTSRKPKKHVRVRTAPAAGSDPFPTPEPPRSSGSENDARLKADKPPHWG
jgi:hypothetical protein